MATINIGIEQSQNNEYVLGTPNTVSITVRTHPLPPLPVTPTYISMWLSLRILVLGYTGPCLRVRRSSDNEEIDIGFDSSELINESELLSFCGSGSGYVTKWYNQSLNPQANQQYVGNASANAQPMIVTNGVMVRNSAGMPAIRCDIGKELFIDFVEGTAIWTERHCFCGWVSERDSGTAADRANMYGIGMDASPSFNYLTTGFIDNCTFYIWGLPNRPLLFPKAWRIPDQHYMSLACVLNYTEHTKGIISTHEYFTESFPPSATPSVAELRLLSVTCFHIWQADFLQGWLSEIVLQSDPVYGWTNEQMITYHNNTKTFWGVPSW